MKRRKKELKDSKEKCVLFLVQLRNDVGVVICQAPRIYIHILIGIYIIIIIIIIHMPVGKKNLVVPAAGVGL